MNVLTPILLSLAIGVLCYVFAHLKGYNGLVAAVGGFVGGFPGGAILLIVLLFLPDNKAKDQAIDDLRKEMDLLRRRIDELEEGHPAPRRDRESGPELKTAGVLADGVGVFPRRDRAPVLCPRCGSKQPGNRDSCYHCGLEFRFSEEEK